MLKVQNMQLKGDSIKSSHLTFVFLIPLTEEIQYAATTRTLDRSLNIGVKVSLSDKVMRKAKFQM